MRPLFLSFFQRLHYVVEIYKCKYTVTKNNFKNFLF